MFIPMKHLFSKTYAVVKVFAFLTIVGLTFYSGMYFVSSSYDTANQKEIMSKAIASAFASTERQPIIMIVPKHSLLEKSKMLIGMDVPERKVVKISTAASTRVLFNEEIQPGLVSTALVATGNGVVYTWNKTKAGVVYAWSKTKVGASWTWEKMKFWGDNENEA